MNMLYGLLFIIVGILIAAIVFLFYSKKKTSLQYHVKVKFAHGVKMRLVLNQTQYDQFRAWLERPDGLWDIGDDNLFVSLNRQNVACVEVKRK